VNRPSEILRQFDREHPGIWRHVDEARLKYRPKYGYLSLKQARAILRAYDGLPDGPVVIEEPKFNIGGLAFLPAIVLLLLSSWRITKGVYRYDPDIYRGVLDTPLDEVLPCSLFHSLPEWCVYIETPDLLHNGVAYPGFFFSVIEGETQEAFAVAWFGGTFLIPCPIGGFSVNYIKNALFDKDRSMEPALHRMMTLALYLCAQNADVGKEADHPGNPLPTKTKRGLRVLPREKVRMWDVGARIGAELRSSADPVTLTEEGITLPPGEESEDVAAVPESPDPSQRARPRPHARRAHRHRYWIKDENGERRLISKWVNATTINATKPDDLIETVRPLPAEDVPQPVDKKMRSR